MVVVTTSLDNQKRESLCPDSGLSQGQFLTSGNFRKLIDARDNQIRKAKQPSCWQITNSILIMFRLQKKKPVFVGESDL